MRGESPLCSVRNVYWVTTVFTPTRMKEGETMHRMRARLSTLTIAFCAMLVFGLLGVVARADESYEFNLTVNATASTDESFVKEVKRAEVQVDVYKIADATKDDTYDTYNYSNWAEGFEEVASDFEAIQLASAVPVDQRPATEWAELYQKAAKVVEDGKTTVKPETKTMVDGTASFDLSDKGIYLVIAHGVGEKAGTSKAYSDRYVFDFPPTMVSAPTKWADESGDMASAIYTDFSYGEWHDSATINLKSSWEPLFGRLIIDKAVENYGLEETTFVFRVRNVATDTVGLGELYDEYASITLNGSSTGSTELTHIPAQLRVQIEETYAGGRYQYVSTEWITDNVILSDHDVETGKGYETEAEYAEVLVNNKRGGDNPGGGHGVENHFSYEDASGNWPIAMRPEKPHTATTE